MEISVGFFYITAKHKDFKFNTIDDFKGYTIGTIDDGYFLDLYKQHKLNLYTTTGVEQQLKMLEAGRFDFMDAALSSTLLEMHQLFPDKAIDFGYIDFQNIVIGPCFLKNNERSMMLKRQLEKGLAIIVQNGKYMEIMGSYWGDNNVPKKALIEGLKQYGVNRPDFKLFHSYQRTPYGKIIRQ